jgi:hypothetical protein
MNEIRSENIKFLLKKGISIDYDLPLIDAPSRVRSKDEIGLRANILHILYAIFLEGSDSKPFFFNEIRENKWEKYLSRKEKSILVKKGMDKQDIIDFSWKREAILPLLWSCQVVGYKLLFDFDNEFILSKYYSKIPPEKELNLFLRSLELLDTTNIVKCVDLYYLLHSLIRHNKLNKGKDGERLSLVIERRKALEWIIDPNTEWDDISLDT